jgi:small subunit ribosomal protein S21
MFLEQSLGGFRACRVFFCKSLRRREVTKVTSVMLRPNESQDALLKRFRKKVVKSGVLSTVRRKRWFISRSELRRVEKKKAIRRIKRRLIGKIIE